MRLNDEINVISSTSVPDGYGGMIDNPTASQTIPAIASVKADELKPQPSGLGFYRNIVVVVDKDQLEIGSTIKHMGVTYSIVRKVGTKHSFQSTYVGYEA